MLYKRILRNLVISSALALGIVAFSHGAMADWSGRDPLVLKEISNRPFGGTVIGEPDESLHCDHGYVTSYIPVNPREVPLLMVHASSIKTWYTTFDGREGFAPIFIRRGFPVHLTDLPRTGQAGQACAPTSYEPDIGNDQSSFTSWRLGTWQPGEGDPTPNFFPGVQFPTDDENALDEFFRIQTPEFDFPENLEIETDALAVLLDEIGPSTMLTHSSTGIRGWVAATKSDNVAAIVSYEPGEYVFPEGEAPPALHEPGGDELSPLTEIPHSEFMKLTEIPIRIVWGDFIPTDTTTFRRIRLIYSQQFADTVNAYGGDAEVVVLPEIGVFGNTHFPMLDSNNKQIANLLYQYLREKGLTSR
jgi:hypothetical protein